MQDLKDIIAHVKPHALIGLSAQGGAWKEEDIQVRSRVGLSFHRGDLLEGADRCRIPTSAQPIYSVRPSWLCEHPPIALLQKNADKARYCLFLWFSEQQEETGAWWQASCVG